MGEKILCRSAGYRLVDSQYRRLVLYEVLLAEINQLYSRIENDNIQQVYYRFEVTGK